MVAPKSYEQTVAFPAVWAELLNIRQLSPLCKFAMGDTTPSMPRAFRYDRRQIQVLVWTSERSYWLVFMLLSDVLRYDLQIDVYEASGKSFGPYLRRVAERYVPEELVDGSSFDVVVNEEVTIKVRALLAGHSAHVDQQIKRYQISRMQMLWEMARDLCLMLVALGVAVAIVAIVYIAIAHLFS